MDRTKDMVKSGGEWISSVDLENAIMAHPKVAEAAVVGVFHPKWQERPLACVVPHAEHKDQITRQEILDFLAPRIAKWWLPDDVVFIEAVPRTSVGKFNKRALRERFRDYTLPTADIPAQGRTNISSLAYELINNRAAADQQAFYAYLDQDSGLNHGFPSGFMGTDQTTITLNAGCIDSSRFV